MADLMQIDDLQLYFGAAYTINSKIVIQQPKIGSIVNYGEQDYFSMVHHITAIPSDMKSQLFDLKIDYEEISDFELFMMLTPMLSVDQTSILFGDLDFQKLKRIRNPQNNQIVLRDKDSGVTIDVLIYERIVNYLRKLHGLKKKVEKAANKYTKKVLIEEDRQRREFNKNKPYESFLRPLISSIKVRQAYSLDHVLNMGLGEFFDEIQRIQIIHNSDALLAGCYTGNIDMKKINKKELNWMRDAD